WLLIRLATRCNCFCRGVFVCASSHSTDSGRRFVQNSSYRVLRFVVAFVIIMICSGCNLCADKMVRKGTGRPPIRNLVDRMSVWGRKMTNATFVGGKLFEALAAGPSPCIRSFFSMLPRSVRFDERVNKTRQTQP